MPLTLHIVGSSVTKGTTYYLIEVSDAEDKWVIKKRYRDFLALDELLTSSGDLSHIALPAKGTFGFRHALGIGSFNERRLQSLEHYIMFLAQQVQSSSCNSSLLEFLSLTIFDGTGSVLSSCHRSEILAPSEMLPEPEVQLLQQVPLAVRIPEFTRSGPLQSRVQYTIVIDSPGRSNTLTKSYSQLQELHSALQSRPFGKTVPLLPSLSTLGAFTNTSQDRLRVQLEAYLSFLCHHPRVLLDDAFWNCIEAPSLTKCSIQLVVAHGLGDMVELVRWIEMLDDLLSDGGDVKSCASPTVLTALTAPLRHVETSEGMCCTVLRILQRLIITKRVRNMLLSKTGAAGGAGLLLKAYLRGGAVADAVQLVFEACGQDNDESERVHSFLSLSDNLGSKSPDNKGRRCCICLDKEASHAFIPCGHHCACLDCAQYFHAQESSCPVCRRTVEGQLQIFSS